jgi:hypothetical protein
LPAVATALLHNCSTVARAFCVFASGREQRDRAFAGDGAEVAVVEGEDGAAVAFGAGDHGRVGEAEGEVGVAADEFADAGEVVVAGLEDEGALFEVGEEGVEDVETEALLDQVADLGEDAGGDQVGAAVGKECLGNRFVVGVAPVEQRKEGGGVERDYRLTQWRASQASLSRAESSVSSPSPSERGRGDPAPSR